MIKACIPLPFQWNEPAAQTPAGEASAEDHRVIFPVAEATPAESGQERRSPTKRFLYLDNQQPCVSAQVRHGSWTEMVSSAAVPWTLHRSTACLVSMKAGSGETKAACTGR
ncbi:hypothetical protein [Salibacterium qingdaonense]|uniref:Uncharacterized protein n=1 Tax=Salibacterium qingdaonense TaxID=266892 RepID=A0A1I4MVK0_9BACI|nr:hypothetical protein [Salibacterium qingdaonense]SFM07107.1 hypothetical protein SAMN04488054_11379 [Salibacterium qingdaonense]